MGVVTGHPGRADDGVVASLRDGNWLQVDVGRLEAGAIAVSILDLATTAVILTTPAYTEFNSAVASSGADHVLLGLAMLGGWTLVYLLPACLSVGWLSTTFGVYVVVTRGVAGGINNLVFFATDVSLVGELGGSFAVEALFPALGFVVGIGWAVAVHDRVPLRELALFVLACGLLALLGN